MTMNFGHDSMQQAIGAEDDPRRLSLVLNPDDALNANEIRSEDVLSGRGKVSFNHVGNRRFRHIIAESIEEYNSAGSRKAKSAVVKRVHENIRATGGRFLRFDSKQNRWVELSQQRSLEKVSHAIRDATSTNENMKKKKEKVKSTIAEVAAHVSSRIPSVHLEQKLDDTDDERLAFKSIESMPPLQVPPVASAPLRGDPLTASVASAPPRLGDSRFQSADSLMMFSPFEQLSQQEQQQSQQQHQQQHQRQRHHAYLLSQDYETNEYRGLSSSFPGRLRDEREHHIFRQQHGISDLQQMRLSQQQQQPAMAAIQPQHRRPEDDFLSFINQVLGPVASDDLNTDPLHRLANKNGTNEGEG